MTTTQNLDHAVSALKQGKLVAFPTETVYGLGADAENEAAVARIFAVKGRPTNHPLIVHLASTSELSRWAARIPPAAERLAEALWPGPLTLLLPKAPSVPAATTGGLDSVGLRVPAHAVALELLRRFGGGVAAPSANRFGRVSPTTAAHVRADLGADVDVVLDGGACDVGVESTILDLTGGAPVLLRPGGVSVERLESLLGVKIGRHAAEGVRAPGMLASHYAPRARVELVPAPELALRAQALAARGQRVAVLVAPGDTPSELRKLNGVMLLDLGSNAADAAQRLYAALRQADVDSTDVIVASSWGDEASGDLVEALADRLSKAAAPR